MSMRATSLVLATATLLAVGCTTEEEAPAPVAQSTQRESSIVTTATVEKVDQQTREVTLRGSSGQVVTAIAGPEVRNLPQLAAGDVVRLTYRERVAVRMAEASEGGPTRAATVQRSAPEGAKPAGLVGAAVSMVVTFQSYDPATGIATFTTPEGQQESVLVDPAMRAFASARSAGDRVTIDLSNALAVSIVENPI